MLSKTTFADVQLARLNTKVNVSPVTFMDASNASRTTSVTPAWKPTYQWKTPASAQKDILNPETPAMTVLKPTTVSNVQLPTLVNNVTQPSL